jgi:CheY-like chemotaxis protein
MDNRPHILLVDDDPAVLELTGELLDVAGYRVTAENTALHALERIAAGERFAAVVTDHSMPGMSGEELALRLRLLAPQTPCLLVTGHGETVNVAYGIRVMTKPFRAAQLAAVLRELLAPPRAPA